MSAGKVIRIAILAMGGEGGGVLADWIVDLAEHNGYVAQLTSVPGVAQRTGATIYYLELFPESAIESGQAPVLALMPVPGDVDLVVASELMEAGRAIQRGIVTPDRTTLIASTGRVFAMSEKVPTSDARVDADALLQGCELAAKRFVGMDMARIAASSGSVISAAMFGAVAGADVLPFGRALFEATIERGGIGVAASKRAFSAAFAEAMGDRAPSGPPSHPAGSGGGPFAEIQAQLPGPVLEIVAVAVPRLVDYQDAGYARLYLDRVLRVAGIDREHGDGTFRLTAETARYLALGMAYEDAVRVADLKTRAARFARVAAEVGVREGQILQIAEFMHPRLQEIAECLPGTLGRFLLRNPPARRLVEALTTKGRIVRTTSLPGFLLLYSLAGLKRFRRSSIRYVETQKSLEAWLERLATAARVDYALALEIAECRNLVKGYGDTHARGTASYEAILASIERIQPPPARATVVASLRQAALADDSGATLAAALRKQFSSEAAAI